MPFAKHDNSIYCVLAALILLCGMCLVSTSADSSFLRDSFELSAASYTDDQEQYMESDTLIQPSSSQQLWNLIGRGSSTSRLTSLRGTGSMRSSSLLRLSLVLSALLLLSHSFGAVLLAVRVFLGTHLSHDTLTLNYIHQQDGEKGYSFTYVHYSL